MEKTELIFIPWPRMGHLTQAIETANLLINRFTNLSITVLLMKDPINPISSNYIDSLSSAHDPSRIRFHPLPSPPPVPAGTFRTPAGMLDIVVDSYKPHVKHAVGQIADRLNSGESRPIGAFVVDMFNTSMIDVADEFAVPTYVFFPSGAGFLQLMLHFQAMDDELGRDVSSLNQSGTELLTPGFVNPVPASVLPFVLVDKYQWSTRFLKYARGYRKARGIIVNTFYELESYAIGSFKDHTPPIYPVGPILGKPQIVETHVDVIHWLDKQPPSSVIFMCFGGQGCFGEKQVMEIANGIERSGFRFLWALRKPPAKGVIGLPSDYTDFKEVLPEGFLERTAEIGKVIGWAPQRAVLANKAVGGFVSHCGWNSILESLMSGIPIATWPMYAEQQLNAFQMVRELGLAAEIRLDYHWNNIWAEDQAVVTAEEIEVGIRKLMDGDSKVREKVKEMKEKCNVTMKEGGSSYECIGQLINDIIYEFGSGVNTSAILDCK